MNNCQWTVPEMAEQYRTVRRAVFCEATRTAADDEIQHQQNQQRLRDLCESMCAKADLVSYGLGKPDKADPVYAQSVWWHLWTKIRYAGIKASLASQEIADVSFCFNDFRQFRSSDWDVECKGHQLLSGGPMVHHFLNRAGPFEGRQTVGNLPKLRRTVNLARRFADAMDTGEAAIDFILGGYEPCQIWQIHNRLMKELNYRGPLTALHFMMDIGLQVVKPDIVLTRQFLQWGWLQSYYDDLPKDLSVADLTAKGPKYGSRYRYDRELMYRRVNDLALEILGHVRSEDLRDDIGWVADNQIREFDMFVVKWGQLPEPDIGIVRTLAKEQSGPVASCPPAAETTVQHQSIAMPTDTSRPVFQPTDEAQEALTAILRRHAHMGGFQTGPHGRNDLTEIESVLFAVIYEIRRLTGEHSSDPDSSDRLESVYALLSDGVLRSMVLARGGADWCDTMFDDWPDEAVTLLNRLRDDPRSQLCDHGAEIYNVNMKREIRAGWQRPGGKSQRMISMARLTAKRDGSLDVFLRVGRGSGMITEDGPLVSGYQGNPSDRDMGRVQVTSDELPDGLFEWIAQASMFTRIKHGLNGSL